MKKVKDVSVQFYYLGNGIITKEDEIEGVCYEIRQAVCKTSLLDSNINIKDDEETIHNEAEEVKSWSLDDFEFGKAIAKGCSAVVYSARLKKSEVCTYVHVYGVHL